MAQTGFTPLLIYSSSTATNAPTAGNLLNNATGSELAINITDGKLFYKDNSNVVQVIGWKTTPATAGGTGLTSFAIGDLIYADTTTTLAKLADVATGNALISGGVGVAPSYGKIGLTTHISGTLAIGNGGTGLTTATTGDIIYASGTNTWANLADIATGNALISGGVGVAPSWGKIGLTTHVSGTLAVGNGGTGLTGFTAANNAIYSTSSSVLTAGTLPVAAGGTGITSLTAGYIPYGNGTSAFSSSSTLTYSGTTLFAGNFVPSSSSIPTNGLYLPAANQLGLATNSSLVATLFSSGGVSIGNTTDPGTGNLSLTAASDCNITMSSSAGAYSSNLRMNSSSGGGSVIRAPYALIGITGGSGGVLLNSGATAWSSYSDKRLKNITGIYDNALSDISKLQPVKFTWKADESNKPCVGVIAQSVETVIPEAIDSRALIDGDSTKYLSVRYTDIIPLMIASIQELNSNLTTLQASYDAYVASHP